MGIYPNGGVMDRNEIYTLVDIERDRQDRKWGAMPRNLSDVVWLAVLVEEVGEAAESILKMEWDNLRKEVIQIIAVGVAWMEDVENHDNGKFKAG